MIIVSRPSLRLVYCPLSLVYHASDCPLSLVYCLSPSSLVYCPLSFDLDVSVPPTRTPGSYATVTEESSSGLGSAESLASVSRC